MYFDLLPRCYAIEWMHWYDFFFQLLLFSSSTFVRLSSRMLMENMHFNEKSILNTVRKKNKMFFVCSFIILSSVCYEWHSTFIYRWNKSAEILLSFIDKTKKKKTKFTHNYRIGFHLTQWNMNDSTAPPIHLPSPSPQFWMMVYEHTFYDHFHALFLFVFSLFSFFTCTMSSFTSFQIIIPVIVPFESWHSFCLFFFLSFFHFLLFFFFFFAMRCCLRPVVFVALFSFRYGTIYGGTCSFIFADNFFYAD